LQRPVRRVLRRVPRPDAALGEGSEQARLRRLAGRPARPVVLAGRPVVLAGRAVGRSAVGVLHVRRRLACRLMSTSRAVTTHVPAAAHPALEDGGLTRGLTTTDLKRTHVLYFTSPLVAFPAA